MSTGSQPVAVAENFDNIADILIKLPLKTLYGQFIKCRDPMYKVDKIAEQ